MTASPDQVESSQRKREVANGAPVAKAEDASFAPQRFGTLKHNITTHWKVEERSHGQ